MSYLTLSTSVSPGGAGTVSKNPNKSGYNYNESVQLTATASVNTGYVFSHWSGSTSGSSNPTTIIMNSNKSITANFDIVQESISIPDTPSGPSSREEDQSGNYSTGGSTSNLGHSVEYRFDWDADGGHDYSAWGSSSRSHSWSAAGTYTVKAQARCVTHTGVVSAWSGGKTVTTGETVSTPDIPSGPSESLINESGDYITGGSVSNLGHTVEYRFDWDADDSHDYSPWGSSTQSNSWPASGTYTVKAQARCATHTGVVSAWSSGKIVNVQEEIQCDYRIEVEEDIWLNGDQRTYLVCPSGLGQNVSGYLVLQSHKGSRIRMYSAYKSFG